MTKVNPDGSAVVFTTYLGGSSLDNGEGIAVDPATSIYVMGRTTSADFPTTASGPTSNGAQDTTYCCGAGGDYYFTKLASDGASLLYSTFVGGSSNEGSEPPQGAGIAVDIFGNAYLTGYTQGGIFPTTGNAFQPLKGSQPYRDAFLVRIDPNVSGAASLIYSTLLGGALQEIGSGVAVDTTGKAYVTGSTKSVDFPTTSGGMQQSFAGTVDGFFSVIDTNASVAPAPLFYSTYFGGTSSDGGIDVAVDSLGNAYLTGWTQSGNFSLPNQLQPQLAGVQDAFVMKIDPTQSGIAAGLKYSTYLGGTGEEYGNGIAVDADDEAYVTGSTTSSDFPLNNALQTVYGGGTDAFVTKLDASGTSSVYSTYLGGSGFDRSRGIATMPLPFAATGDAYVVGETNSSDFPTASFDNSLGGTGDAFVAKISAGPPAPVPTQLVFSGEPSNTISGFSISPPVVLTVQDALARIHRRTSLGTALEEASGCSSESGIMVLEQKPARKQGAPNRCCHRTNPTVSASSLTTIAWWPMPACSCRPP